MKDLILSDLPEETYKQLELRASSNRRPIEAEAASILTAFLERNAGEVAERAAAIRAKLSGRKHSDSAILLAQDRGR